MEHHQPNAIIKKLDHPILANDCKLTNRWQQR